MSDDRYERFVAENVSETIWLRLRRLTSERLCEQLLVANNSGVPLEIIAKKSTGMAYAIQSALGYWDTREGGLNSKILSRYYALLQITIAEQISSLANEEDLGAVQRHTESGHGLCTVPGPADVQFPANYFVGCLKSGHFAAYTKSLGIDLDSYANAKRPRKLNDSGTLLSLAEFLCRVPELRDVIKEYLGLEPLSFHVGHDQLNNVERTERMKAHAKKTGQVLFDPPREGPIQTYVSIFVDPSTMTPEQFNTLGFNISDVRLVSGLQKRDPERHLFGQVTHPVGTQWYDVLQTYKSGYCGTSLIAPFWGTQDPFLLHFIILYAISIIVRYLPERWHSIERGKLDNIRALLEHYLVIVDNVLPRLAVERLTRRHLLVTQPGSLFAPV